ncbi:MAG: type II toxin-antitoxin system VapC family toxin [Vicinamibacterales bacterium]
MRLLVDTHAFLWFMAGDARLSATARHALEDDSEWWLSAASVWELSIMSSLKRLVLPVPAADYVAEKVQGGLRVLSVEWVHAAMVERLPFHHRDPFDRLLVAQAQVERAGIVTSDPVFRRYGVRVVW